MHDEYAIKNGFKVPTFNHLREWNFIIINSLESKPKLIKSEMLDNTINIEELEILFKNEETIINEMYLDANSKQKR